MNPITRPTRFAFLIACSLTYTAAAASSDKCFDCHVAQGDKPSSLFQHDIHRQKGIACSGCHGGNASTDDMERAMDKGAGFLGVPKGDAVSLLCSNCHSSAGRMREFHSTLPVNQYELLQSSVHARLSTTGKERIVQCTTCHGAHGIVPVRNPASPVYPLNVVKTCAHCHANAAFMRMYNPGLAIDQLEKYRTSVHGTLNAKGDFRTAECASCHGGHDVLPAKDVRSKVHPVNLPGTCAGCHSNAQYMRDYGIPTDQFEKFSKSVHGVALLQKHDLGAPACNSCHGNHGATPPGVESISKVCGTCHAINADLFSSSPHKKAFDERNLPECETCHGNHEIIAASNKLLGVSPDAVCSRCHSERDTSGGYGAARGMRRAVDSLTTMEDQARVLVEEAEQKGMEIGEAKFRLRDARQARLEARTTVHAFNEEKLREVTGRGLVTANAVAGEARSAIDEYFFRRIGLGISTLIITVLAISLYVFIRRIEHQQTASDAGESGKK